MAAAGATDEAGSPDEQENCADAQQNSAEPEQADTPDAVYEDTAATFEAMTGDLPAPARPMRSPRRPGSRAGSRGRKIAVGLAGTTAVMLAVIAVIVTHGTRVPQVVVVDDQGLHALTTEGRQQYVPPTDAAVAPDPYGPGTEDGTGEDGISEDGTGEGIEPVPESACPENTGRIVATQPSAAVTRRIDAAWRRIETWLAAHAPADAAALQKPAAPARIDAVQRRMSVAFPPDLVASLRRHDGITDRGVFALPPFYLPQGLGEIVSDWRTSCSILTDQRANGEVQEGEPWWDPQFVPFAGSADGGSLLVDQRPGGHGRVGDFHAEEGVSFADWPASVTGLLEGTATSLETGKPYAGSYRPYVTRDGHLDWDIIITGG
jgi:cell wall assembly regulator SMI1